MALVSNHPTTTPTPRFLVELLDPVTDRWVTVGFRSTADEARHAAEVHMTKTRRMVVRFRVTEFTPGDSTEFSVTNPKAA